MKLRRISKTITAIVATIAFLASYPAGLMISSAVPLDRSVPIAESAGPVAQGLPRVPVHTPLATTNIATPAGGAVLTGPGSVSISGDANADCSPDPRAARTYVQRVEVQIGTGSSWSWANIRLKDGDCRADWSIQLPLPAGQDGKGFPIRARTLSNHGGDEFMQESPTQIGITVDSVPPNIALAVGSWSGGPTIPVSWSATDGAGISAFNLEFSVDNSTWQAWQSSTSGNATFNVPSGLPAPGRVIFFRALATDLSGVQGKSSAFALNPSTKVFVPGVLR